MLSSSSVSVNWDLVFADPNAATSLREFVDGNTGFRSSIRRLRPTARREMYRLERAGVESAKRRVRTALKKRSV